MPWSSIADNQTISRANLQDAINQGYFTLKAAFPSDNKQVTKDNADAYINIPDADWPGYTTKSGNQLLTKYDLPTTVSNNGNFILDPQYGTTFTSLSGNAGGFPSFSFPVTSTTTVPFNYTIVSQTISLGIGGSPAFTPQSVGMYINGALISSQQITAWPTTLNFGLFTDVRAGETIKFAVTTGTTPPPPSYTFQGQSVNNVLISKGGTYGLLTTGTRFMSEAGLDAVTASGLLYVTSNGGASWTNTGIRQFWTSIASSDNGQYMIAVGNNGYIFTSTNFGANWTQRTSAGKTNWNSCCVFNNGTMLAVSRFGATGNVYRSINAFSSFVNVAPEQSTFVTIACGNGYGNAILTDGLYIWRSTDFATTWTKLDGSSGAYPFVKTGTSYIYGARINPNGDKVTLLYYYTEPGTNIPKSTIRYSTDYGVSFNELSGANINISSTGMWLNSGLSNASSSYYVVCPQVPLSLNTYPRVSSNFGTLSQLISPGTAYWQSIDVSNGGSTILLGGNGGTSGLFRSTNSGSSFQPI